MSAEPLRSPDIVDDATEAALQRMHAARDEVRRTFFSPEAMANEYPADAPEFLGIMSPEVMRDARKSRAVR
jgi:hypothetical protein